MNAGLEAAVANSLRRRARFGSLESVFWIAAFATVPLLPEQHSS
jgi:hypothetical protein